MLDQLLQGAGRGARRDVVHGDVKPANLLLHAPTGPLVLADFGVATRAGDAVGSSEASRSARRGFLAPEREAGAPPHPSQDVYAAGVVARRMLPRSPA